MLGWISGTGDELMANVKIAIEAIKNCNDCYGKGYVGWISGDDYDWEFCDCNPNGILESDM